MNPLLSQPRGTCTAEPPHTTPDAFGAIADAADDAVWSDRLAGLVEDLEREAARASCDGSRRC